MSEFNARDYAVGLLLQQTERDKQVSIGASNMSNLCTRCLARDIGGDRRGNDTRAFLGGKVGTGIHSVMEAAIGDDPNALVERKLVIGELGGRTIKSKPDLALINEKALIDWKSGTRAKSKAMQQFLGMPVSSPIKDPDKLASGEAKVRQYINQCQIYAKALNESGVVIETVHVVNINRDGTGWFDHPSAEEYQNPNKQRDVWSFSVPYSEQQAQRLWDRTVRIYDYLWEGNDPEELPRYAVCWRCDMIAEADMLAQVNETAEVSHA